MKKRYSACGSIVKTHDPERFLASLFAPLSTRQALWALFAFNHEIAKTREVVTETQLGLMRLQWWREELAKIYKGQDVAFHEVLSPLASAIKTYDLSRSHFEALIYAREFDLEDVLPSKLEGTVMYADYTNTPLLYLAVQIMGGDPECEPVQVVATNYGLSGLLRAVPFHAAQRRCYLPEDMMSKHGVYLNQLYDGKSQSDLPHVVSAVAEYIVPGVNTGNRLLRVLQALAVMHKNHMKTHGYNVFHPRIALGPAFKEIRVYFASLFT